MNMLKMHTPNLTQDNMARIRELFPNCVTEAEGKDGKLTLAVDFDLLRQELSESIVEGPQERYRLDWQGKRKALLAANAPIAKTLRPCREESVDFDATKNLYIEGDNLDALKLIQETYLGKVKMIYIDPPYNTGNNFIYKDNFTENTDEFLRRSNQKDEEGNRLVANTESNGRFHSDWLSMMYPRLKLARNLLKEDGVIFISCDDREVNSLTQICSEVLGANNIIATVIWQKRISPANDAQWYSSDHEYLIICAKNKFHWRPERSKRTQEQDKYYKNPDNDHRGDWNSATYTCNKSKSERPSLYFGIVNPNTDEMIFPDDNAVWKYSKEKHIENERNNLLYWGVDGKSKTPRIKQFLTEAKKIVPRSIWNYNEVGSTQSATTDIRNLFCGAVFTYPKPLNLIKKVVYQATKNNDLILDFFSGSATTAHAVMQLNAEDGGNRQFIMVQLPEPCDEKSEAHKAGYKTIAEIGKERIRRAGAKIKAELEQKNAQNGQGSLLEENNIRATPLDIGFRVLKVDSSNMADVYYAPDKLDQHKLDTMTDNIKIGRTPEDLLFQVLLDWGVELTLPIRKESIQDKTVFFVDENALVACFDTDLTEDLVKELAHFKPLRVVFRDNGFASDTVKINATQIFRQMSPGTEVKAI